MDWKASLIVQELKKYRVSVTVIGEIKWFGQAVYKVEGYTIWSACPCSVHTILRSEGVGIVWIQH